MANCGSCGHANDGQAERCERCGAALVADTAASSSAGAAFVGREREVDELRRSLEDTIWGRGRVVLLTGEPGIGKTRLASEITAHARRRGARVLTGRCYEGEGAPPYWPWLQAIRMYAADREPAALAVEMGPAAADIARVLPELRDRLPDSSLPASLAPEAARFRFFDGLTGFLKRASTHQPLLLILDDLHWADLPSLLLLVFLARDLGESRLMVVGTCREAEPTSGDALGRALADFAREAATRRISLRGLTERDVGRLIEQIVGRRASDAVVAAVWKQTGGNPLYLNEVVRLLVSQGGEDSLGAPELSLRALPEGIRDVIDRRLERLTPRCRQVLAGAAVLGRQFRVDLLARVTVLPSPELLESLEEARAARIVEELPGGLGRYAFSHALVCEALYQALPARGRVELHERAAEALEEYAGEHRELYLDDLAYHCLRAAPLGRVQRAIDYAVQAGRRATAMLAWEAAVGHYAAALQALDLMPLDDRQLAEILVALGESQRRAGETVGARETFSRAVGIARRRGDGSMLAHAALGYAGVWSEAGLVDETAVSILREALATLEPGGSALRVRLLARLALELYLGDEGSRLSQEAVETARRLADQRALLGALHSRHATLLDPAALDERLAVATEIVRHADTVGDPELTLQGHYWRLADLLELGDLKSADEALHAYARLAETLRQPLYLSRTAFRRAMRALLEGRFEEAETLAGQGLSLGQRAQNQTTLLIYGVQIWTLRREQGRLEEVEPALRAVIAEYPAFPAWRAALVYLHAELGRTEEARAGFEELARGAFATLPRDAFWLVGMTLLAEVASYLGDSARAVLLHERLEPFGGRHVVIGRAAAAYYGVVARPLALLARTMGRWDDAAAHFERALDLHARLGARPWLAHTWYEYAAMLVARGRRQDRDEASRLLGLALDTARQLGMQRLQDRVVALGIPACPADAANVPLSPAPGSVSASVGGSPPAHEEEARPEPANAFRRDGDYWTLAYEGQVCRLKDSKGLRYIAYLLRHPGRSAHVAQVLEASEPGGEGPGGHDAPSPAELDALGLGVLRPTDAGAAMDSRARAAYRERLQELDAEIGEAERWRDEARAAHIREEMDALTQELSAAFGLGGRPRRVGDPAERARKAVANRIRDALARIQPNHPSLAQHLANAIRTGTFCAYTPERPPSWEL